MANDRVPLDVSNATPWQKEKILEYAVEGRKFEIERFWHRSFFFWGFIGAAFVAYAQLTNKVDRGMLPLSIACFGLVCSVAWTLQNRGSKYWHEAWEAKVESVEKDVLGVPLFSNREPLQRKGFWGARAFSVTKLAIALSDFTVLVWVGLALRTFPFQRIQWGSAEPIIAAVVTVLFIAALFTSRQSDGSQWH